MRLGRLGRVSGSASYIRSIRELFDGHAPSMKSGQGYGFAENIKKTHSQSFVECMSVFEFKVQTFKVRWLRVMGLDVQSVAGGIASEPHINEHPFCDMVCAGVVRRPRSPKQGLW